MINIISLKQHCVDVVDYRSAQFNLFQSQCVNIKYSLKIILTGVRLVLAIFVTLFTEALSQSVFQLNILGVTVAIVPYLFIYVFLNRL